MRALWSFVWLQVNQPEVRYFTLKDPNPEPSLAWFILNAFILIAAMLATMVALGVAFGGFRFWLLSKFPHNWFNGEDEDDVTKTFKLTD